MRTCIFVRNHRRLARINVADITHFTSDDGYVIAHAKDGQLRLDESLNSLEKEFGADFIRSHREALVRRSLVREFVVVGRKQGAVVLAGVPRRLPVSLRNIVPIKALFDETAA